MNLYEHSIRHPSPVDGCSRCHADLYDARYKGLLDAIERLDEKCDRLAADKQGAVEALKQIADPECMVRGTGGWLDTEAPARIAEAALDALGGQ